MRKILLIPTSAEVELTNIATNLTDIIAEKKNVVTHVPLDIATIEFYLGANRQQDLLEIIVAETQSETIKAKDVVVMQGLELSTRHPYAAEFNLALATALDATIIFVSTIYQEFEEISKNTVKIIVNPYLTNNLKVFGAILDNSKTKYLHPIDNFEDFFDMFATQLGYFDGKNCILDAMKLDNLDSTDNNPKISAAMFCAQLMKNARQAKKKIVLPEGDEPRTLQAANICAERDLAQCILLGKENTIREAAKKIGITLNEKLVIVDPESQYEKYANALFEIRKNKGLTLEEARKQVTDNVMIGTLMLHFNEVDGLVSGAVHTTANTIRPALQIIKTVPESKIVSSVFFMCLPDQVLVYGDCAINPNPTAEQLADIAIQSAISAASFGIPPRVAMLSYSTGTSGAGPSIELVAEATAIAKKLRPDLEIEGPIQYDAAISPEVAALKLPNSKVAGKATVFIFPDLNAGNLACKAVQRSTNITCIGPMLQGIRKPVNDLSRGCFVEDIVFTIAVTAVQAVTGANKS